MDHPPLENSRKEQAGGEALGCASELGSVYADFNYSIIRDSVAPLAYQFWITNGSVPCLVPLGSDLVPGGGNISFG